MQRANRPKWWPPSPKVIFTFLAGAATIMNFVMRVGQFVQWIQRLTNAH